MGTLAKLDSLNVKDDMSTDDDDVGECKCTNPVSLSALLWMYLWLSL